MEVKVTLRISGKDLVPNEITKLLRSEPNYCHQRGDPNVGKSGRQYGNYDAGVWLIESGAQPTDDIQTHIVGISSWLNDRSVGIAQCSKLGYDIDVLVGVFNTDSTLPFSIPSDIVAQFGKLRIGLEFDLYG